MWIEASQPCNRLAKLKLHLLLREENLYAIEFGASSLSRNLDTISRVLKKTAFSTRYVTRGDNSYIFILVVLEILGLY